MRQMAQAGMRGGRWTKCAALLIALGACSAEHDAAGSTDGASEGKDDPDAAAGAVFSITVPRGREGLAPMLSLNTEDRIYFSTCHDNGFPWEASIDGSWVALRDERSTYASAGYYLNDHFVEPYTFHGSHDGAACSCYQLIEGKYLGPAEEYVRVGDMSGPGARSGAPLAAVLERRSVTRQLRARITYFREERCQTELQALVVPE